MSTHEPLLISAYRGKQGERPPVWLMRQAGRFLPEYRELRARHSLLELFQTPRLAAEVTLQPLNRFALDAAIIFADILTPLIGLGFDLQFVEGRGPRFRNPLDDPLRVARLRVPRPEENAAYTIEAVRIAAAELSRRDLPLIGFCGAPFTLSCYLIEGGSPDANLVRVKRFMLQHPAAWQELQELLVELLSGYLAAQVGAGAAAVQIFDSWLGGLAPAEYARCAAPYLARLIAACKAKAGVPVVFFSTGTSGLLPRFAGLGADCIGVDWRISLGAADRLLGGTLPLQGNLDPALLCGPLDALLPAAAAVIREGRTLRGHVFNLGHGVLPETPLESVEKLVELVRSSTV